MIMRWFRRISLVLAIAAAACTAHGGDAVVKLIRHDVAIPESGKVVGYLLAGGRDDIAFIPPHKWQVNLDAEKYQVTFISPDWSTSLGCRVNWTGDETAPKLDLRAARERVQARHPEAKITQDFECYAANQTGRAFDLEVVTGNSKMAVREIVMPFAHGYLDITLTTMPAKFPASHLTVTWFLNSLQIKPAGAFHAAPATAAH